MAPTDLPQPHDDDDESGLITLFLVILMAAMLGVIALVADAPGKVAAERRAYFVASEAARAADQAVDPASVRGDGTGLDTVAATAAANAYLASAGVAGVVTVTSVDTVHVETTVAYDPPLLSRLGIRSTNVHGSADAHLARGLSQEGN